MKNLMSKNIFIKNCFAVLFSAEVFYRAVNTMGTQSNGKGSDFSGYSGPAAEELFALRVRAGMWGTEMGMSFHTGGSCHRKQTVSTCFRKDDRRICVGRGLGGL